MVVVVARDGEIGAKPFVVPRSPPRKRSANRRQLRRSVVLDAIFFLAIVDVEDQLLNMRRSAIRAVQNTT